MKIYLVGTGPGNTSKISPVYRRERMIKMGRILLSYVMIQKIIPNALGYIETWNLIIKEKNESKS